MKFPKWFFDIGIIHCPNCVEKQKYIDLGVEDAKLIRETNEYLRDMLEFQEDKNHAQEKAAQTKVLI